MTAHPDLFGRPAFPGFDYEQEFVSPEEEALLIAAIDDSGLSPFRFQGWTGKRLTASFGWHYDFDQASFRHAEAFPQYLRSLRDRAANFAGLPSEDFVQALLTRYDPGAGIGWHRDRPIFEHVVGISFGDPATMRFRRRSASGFERYSACLDARSIYHLSGEARYDWEHSIAPSELGTRWSITFRSLSAKGQELAALAR